MNLSYRWLRALAPELEDSPEQLADRMAELGAPVDELRPLGAELGDVVIANVLSAGPHPNADRLWLCRVDAGTGEVLSVVCGAPNVRAGGWYPFAPVGASLPGGVTIRKARIRGEISQGMLCSERELGLGSDQAGIMELTGRFSPGEPLRTVLELDDVRIVADVTANRPDLLSHIGFARDLAPAGEADVRLPAPPGGRPALYEG
ncbi:MAG: YtpR family tRNA-binding protein, partial [Longimicrobiales bacterium]